MKIVLVLAMKDFIRDMAMIIELVEGSIYRDMKMPHQTHKFVEEFVDIMKAGDTYETEVDFGTIVELANLIEEEMMMTPKFHEPFSPAILETTVTQRFVNIVNNVSDDVLSSEEKSKKWDWSHKLVGKVSKEILIPVTDKDDREFLLQNYETGMP